jgi:mRNA interferase RelE/StbE
MARVRSGEPSATMYKVLLQRHSKKYFARCNKATARRLAQCFTTLEQQPRGGKTKALSGALTGLHRCRVGDLRVVYEIDEANQQVNILAILPRGDAYKRRG